jgi:hypothetical protein
LELEGVNRDAVLGDNEPKKVVDGDAKYTLEGFQEDSVPMTSLKSDA